MLLNPVWRTAVAAAVLVVALAPLSLVYQLHTKSALPEPALCALAAAGVAAAGAYAFRRRT